MIITQLKEKFTFNCSKGETVIRILHAMLLFLTEYDVILHHTAINSLFRRKGLPVSSENKFKKS